MLGDRVDRHAQETRCTLARQTRSGRSEVLVWHTCIEETADAQIFPDHGTNTAYSSSSPLILIGAATYPAKTCQTCYDRSKVMSTASSFECGGPQHGSGARRSEKQELHLILELTFHPVCRRACSTELVRFGECKNEAPRPSLQEALSVILRPPDFFCLDKPGITATGSKATSMYHFTL